MVLISACKKLQENQAISWIKKPRKKNPPKQESLGFLERTVHSKRGGESRKPTKNQGEIQSIKKQVFWLDFCAKKKDCAYPLWLADDSAADFSGGWIGPATGRSGGWHPGYQRSVYRRRSPVGRRSTCSAAARSWRVPECCCWLRQRSRCAAACCR